ncbi:hypothetical protein Bca52824_094858 [Brassica carinata]|uniref:Zinc finger PHD-type domain-containing protein n=1 Tax=Brassica carinata TaxID=52824 RepID=A0A8X7TJE2_BRACI|nr:hypothetical protein Bca52824_094858 [Brassica carinata]
MASTAELPTGQEDRSRSNSSSNLELENWIRIIEYIAKFKTELWMLHDVFEMGPKQLPDNLGELTNEMVAFRCLASLFDSSTSKDDVASADADAESKIDFDSSQSCEHVLQCILDEIPLSELKPGSPLLSKWNVLPFIKSKLLCLPKCALELMIEASSEKDAEVSPCNGEEGIMRIDGRDTEQVTSPIADPEPFVHGSGDGADEICRSHALFDESNHDPEDEADKISRSLENGSDSSHVSSPSENRYKCIQCKQSGKLLFCSRDGCTVMVHEKCVVDSRLFTMTLATFTALSVLLAVFLLRPSVELHITSNMSSSDLSSPIQRTNSGSVPFSCIIESILLAIRPFAHAL